jgi:hypothetical protein
MGSLRLPALAGLAVLAAAALAHNLPRLAPGMRDWAEPGNVAAALAEGRGFSDPFDGGTGATAWVSPLPTFVEAGAFALFGVKTAAAARALLVLSVAGLAAAHLLLHAALRPWGLPGAAAASAAFLAYACLVPGGPLEVLSEAWLDILLSALLLWAALGWRRAPTRAAAGALVAAALLGPLDNGGLVVATAGVLGGLAWLCRREPARLAAVALAGAAAAAGLAAWTVRNAESLGRLIPLKSNLWFELNLANVAAADGLPRVETVLHQLPFFDAAQFGRYARLGEVRYVDSFRAPAMAALRADPAHFAANVARRLALAAVYCRREGGAEATSARLGPGDRERLAAAGQLIPIGAQGGMWGRIDQDPAYTYGLFRSLGLSDLPAAWADWGAKRLAYDDRFRSPRAIATGFATAGLPVLALLVAAALGHGRLGEPGLWALAIAAGMLLPYVIVNHNERHQLPLIALQAAALGSLAQALAGRRRAAA